MTQEGSDKVRCNLYIPKKLISEVDKLAKEFGANRSVMVSVILKTYMDQQEVINLSKMAQRKEMQSQRIE